MINAISRRQVVGLILITPLAGCGGGGSKSETKTDVKVETTTKGQRLYDLKKALDSGAIDQTEYERERKKILEN